MDTKKVQKYFKSTNIVPGIIGCVIGLTGFSVSFWGGLAWLAIGAALIIFQFIGRPSDEDIDNLVASQLNNMKERAMRKLGVDEDEVSEVAPISFDGYVYNNAQIQCGKDGKYRSNKYEAVMFFFSSNEVHCYTYNFCITDGTQKESTDVYFYKDIVSVSTQTENTEYTDNRNKKKAKTIKFDYEYFKLTTTGGTYISCSVRDAGMAQRSINGMRSLIKSKKMG